MRLIAILAAAICVAAVTAEYNSFEEDVTPESSLLEFSKPEDVAPDAMAPEAALVESARPPVVYQHCNFGGYKRTVRRSTNWVKKLGIKNDDLSSIKVPRGKCVRLYEHINYRGKSWTICGKRSIKCFVHHKMKKGKTWNDQVSSIRVFNRRSRRRRVYRPGFFTRCFLRRYRRGRRSYTRCYHRLVRHYRRRYF